MVPLNGDPLLEHLVKYLFNFGVRRFIICVGHKAEAIEKFVKDREHKYGDIVCVDSGDAGMTDRIRDAREHVRGLALVCYGDTLANVDLAELLAHHRRTGALSTVTVYPLHSPFGIVDTDDESRVQSFREKPKLPYWINIGFLVCEPSAFEYLADGADMVSFLSVMAAAGVLFSYQHTGKHLTVNTEKERVAAETEMVEFYTYMDGQIR